MPQSEALPVRLALKRALSAAFWNPNQEIDMICKVLGVSSVRIYTLFRMCCILCCRSICYA